MFFFQDFSQRRHWHIGTDHRFAYALEQNKTHFSIFYFFVQFHQVQIFLRAKLGSKHRQPGLQVNFADTLNLGLANQTHALRQFRRQHRARRHRLPV